MKARGNTLTAMAAVAAIWGGVQTASAETIGFLQPTTVSALTGPKLTFNGGVFTTHYDQPAGTGYIDPFIRLQDSPYEQGYNTDHPGKPEFGKDNGGTNWNHSIQLQDIGTTYLDGVAYLEFALDINETNGTKPDQHLVTMYDLQIYLDDQPDNHSYADGLGTLVYDLDGAGDSSIVLDHKFAPGSGKFDMLVHIPKDLFTGPGTQYVYLYSAFGRVVKGSDHYPSDAGFEEWVHKKADGTTPPPAVPLPGVALAGLSLMGLVGARRGIRGRRGRDAGEA